MPPRSSRLAFTKKGASVAGLYFRRVGDFDQTLGGSRHMMVSSYCKRNQIGGLNNTPQHRPLSLRSPLSPGGYAGALSSAASVGGLVISRCEAPLPAGQALLRWLLLPVRPRIGAHDPATGADHAGCEGRHRDCIAERVNVHHRLVGGTVRTSRRTGMLASVIRGAR